MKTKIVAVVIIVFLLISTLLLVFLRKPEATGIPAINAIPVNSGIVVKVNGLIPLLTSISENEYFLGIPDVSISSSIQLLKEKLDSISDNNSFVYDILHDSAMYISLHPNGKESFSVNFYIPFKPSVGSLKVSKLLSSFNTSDKSIFSLYRSDKKVTAEPYKSLYYYYISKGLLVIGNNYKHIVESYLQISNKQNLSNDTAFVKVNATTGQKVQANVMLNFQQLSRFLENRIKTQAYPDLQKALDAKGWAALDLNIDRKFISVHGFASVSGKKPLWLKAIRNEQPAELYIQNMLPASTIAYGIYSLTDIYNYKLAIKENSSSDVRLAENIKKLREQFGKAIDDKLFEKMNESVAYVLCQTNNEISTYCIVKTQNSIAALDFVSQFREHKKARQQKKNANDSLNLNITSAEMATMPSKNLPIVLFGNVFKTGTYQVVANYKEYLVFGSSKENVKSYLSEIQSLKTLGYDSVYIKAISELQASKANITIHLNLAKFWSYITPIFEGNSSSFIENHINPQSNAMANIQISGNGDMLYISSFLYAENKETNRTNLRWSVALDSSLNISPLYMPSNNLRDAQYFLQDKKMNIYLVSGNGKILWRKKLDEPILGSSQIIDYFKNGKNQILFNTCKYLYLFDKTGKSIKGFPVKFKQQASNGLSVADFDANLNYRYYLAFKNRTFLVLSKTGRKVDGWKFGKTSAIVSQPARCFKFKGKEYITFSDSTNLYTLSRQGEQAIKTKKPFHKSVNSSIFIDLQPNFFKLVAVSNSGYVCNIYPDGHVDSLKFDGVGSQTYFDFYDINADGQNDYVFIDSSYFMSYTRDKKLISSFPLPVAIDSKPYILKTANGSLSFIFQSISKQSIWRTDNNGKIYEGFPINGNSQQNVITLSDKKYSFGILTTEENDFVCYLMQ